MAGEPSRGMRRNQNAGKGVPFPAQRCDADLLLVEFYVVAEMNVFHGEDNHAG